ncbi:MAG: tRNA dihydrouridine synthase DusB [Tissierellia bacterium]|nr:tRNA dihydrouridine synthase DusB [Tissierellia bacterium]
MQIGKVALENDIVLAPMAGVTDRVYRTICREMGAGLVVTEMVSCKGLYYGDEKTKNLTYITADERPVALQIFGSDPDIMAKVVESHINNREDIDILDINMGCPTPKIVKNGGGAALLKNPKLVRKILKSIVRVSNKPVTVKIRMGWDFDSLTGIEIAKIAEEEGIAAITIHGRTRNMFYSGKADWEYIKKVKESVHIPVIGNGDVFEPMDAIKMMEYTGCDGVAIGRGAMGNPWIFKRILALKEGKKDMEPSSEEKINMAIKHLNLLCLDKGELVGVKEMRKHIAWYIKGMKNSNRIKNIINSISSKDEVEKVLLDYLSEINPF